MDRQQSELAAVALHRPTRPGDDQADCRQRHAFTRSLRTATAAIAITLPQKAGRALSHAYDEGRAAERILIGANMLGLGAGIAWIPAAGREIVSGLLGVPPDWRVLTVVAIGHPTAAARRPKSAPGKGRLPREEVVFDEALPHN